MKIHVVFFFHFIYVTDFDIHLRKSGRPVYLISTSATSLSICANPDRKVQSHSCLNPNEELFLKDEADELPSVLKVSAYHHRWNQIVS